MKKFGIGLFILGAIASVGTLYALISFGKMLEENDNYFDEEDHED
jgi:hypothetical protein